MPAWSGLPLRMVGEMLTDVGLMVFTDVAIVCRSVEWWKVLCRQCLIETPAAKFLNYKLIYEINL